MSSPEFRRRRSISFTPDENDEEVSSSSTHIRPPTKANGNQSDEEEAGSDDEGHVADKNKTKLGDTNMGDVTKAISEGGEDYDDDDNDDNDNDDSDEEEDENDDNNNDENDDNNNDENNDNNNDENDEIEPDGDAEANISVQRGPRLPASASEDVKPSAWSLSKASKTLADILAATDAPIPDDINPGSANLYSTAAGEKL